MRSSLIAIGLILPLGIALAQKEPGNQSTTNGSNTAANAGESQKGQTSTSEVKTQTYKVRWSMRNARAAVGPRPLRPQPENPAPTGPRRKAGRIKPVRPTKAAIALRAATLRPA